MFSCSGTCVYSMIGGRNLTRRVYSAVLYFCQLLALRRGSRWRRRYSDSLQAGRSGNRIPVGGETFRTRPDRPWDPPSLLLNGYRVFPWGIKRPGRDIHHPPPSSFEVKERIQLHLYSRCGLSWPVLGWNFALLLLTLQCQPRCIVRTFRSSNSVSLDAPYDRESVQGYYKFKISPPCAVAGI